MAVMENSLLRDLFQNNIDFVAKQWGRILDAIYGEQATENTVVDTTTFFYRTTQIMGASGSDIKTGMTYNNQAGVYSVTFDDRGFSIENAGRTFITTDNSSNSQIAILNEQVEPYLKSFSCTVGLDAMDVDHFYCEDSQIRVKKTNGYIDNFSINQPFGIDTNQRLVYEDARISDLKQSWEYEDRDGYSYYGFTNFSDFIYGSRVLYLYSISMDNPTSFVLFPSSDSTGTYNIINQYDNSVNIDGDTVYNYYNDNGDIVINGGGIGGGGAVIAPVGGLAYADVKLILDSLVDDLNLTFDFGANGGTPLGYAPTWEELHYIDQGSFYITPVEQINTLPEAPDVGDTFPNLSDYLTIVGGAVTSFYNMVDGLGVSLMLVFTFLICLVINHLKKG